MSLAPEDLDALVLWTRNPGPFLETVKRWEVLGIRTLWLITITGYPRTVEPYAPETIEAVDSLKRLSSIVGRERIFWRYDPIFLAPTAGMSADYHETNFGVLARALAPFARRVIVSLYDDYKSARARLAKAGISVDVDHGKDFDCGFLSKIASREGIEIRSCCEKMIESGIAPGSCIDGAALDSLWDLGVAGKKDKSQRPGCHCAPSVDIGTYNTCSHGCLYCYAGSFRENASKAFSEGPEQGM